MKHIRVTVTEEYLLPDDWEILTHPEDQLPCLHGDNHHFAPHIEWSERGFTVHSGRSKTARQATWTAVDEVRDDWFMEHMLTTATEIRDTNEPATPAS